MRPIPEAAAELARQFEGCKLWSYKCPAGVWTIGYGHTGGIERGQKITQAQAEAYLLEDLQDAARKLEGVVGHSVLDTLNPNQYAALLDFVFNLGANKSWTIWKKLNARDFAAVPAQLLRFVYAGGQKLSGLERRRRAEADLWGTPAGVISTEPEQPLPSSGALREMPTPPAPAADAKPLVQSKTVWAGAATAATGAIEVVKQVQTTVGEQQANSPLLQGIFGNLAVVVVALGVAVIVIRWLDERAKRR